MNVIIKPRNSKQVSEKIVLQAIEDLRKEGYENITISDISKKTNFSHSWVYKIVKGLNL